VVSDPEDAAEVDGDAPGSGEPRRTARRRTHARARRRESARRTHHGRCCHRRLNDGRRWSRNGRRLIGPRAPLLSPEGQGGRRRAGIWDALTAAPAGCWILSPVSFLLRLQISLGLVAARPGRQRRVLVLLDRRALLDCAATC